MLFFAFIKLVFSAIVFFGIAALGMMAFRAMRRRWAYAHHTAPPGWAGDEYSAAHNSHQAPVIVLGAPQSRPITLAMRQRSIEVR